MYIACDGGGSTTIDGMFHWAQINQNCGITFFLPRLRFKKTKDNSSSYSTAILCVHTCVHTAIVNSRSSTNARTFKNDFSQNEMFIWNVICFVDKICQRIWRKTFSLKFLQNTNWKVYLHFSPFFILQRERELRNNLELNHQTVRTSFTCQWLSLNIGLQIFQ